MSSSRSFNFISTAESVTHFRTSGSGAREWLELGEKRAACEVGFVVINRILSRIGRIAF